MCSCGPPIAVSLLDRDLLAFGSLLVFAAAAAGLVHRSLLSLTGVFVLAGFALGSHQLDVLHFDPRSGFVAALAQLALIVILFRDGLEVEGELLQKAWHLPLRKLVIAMPLTAALVALITKAVTDLSWTESLLVGALLSPTDPVLSSSVVTNPRVPRLIRHSLNLESGLNDGLALPAVLALASALSSTGSHFVLWRFVARDVGLGVLAGLLVAWIGARLVPRTLATADGDRDHAAAVALLGVALACFGFAAVVRGNGFIAVFVCAIALAQLRPELGERFEHGAAGIIELLKAAIFVVFGSLLSIAGLFGDGWAAVAIVAFTLLIARGAAVGVALAGSKTDRATVAFMSWFGPKGVATMTFSLIILSDRLSAGERIFNVAALCVLASVLLHGMTDGPGVNWIVRRADRLSSG